MKSPPQDGNAGVATPVDASESQAPGLPSDLERCLELVHSQYAPVPLPRWEVRGFENGVLRLACEPFPDESWIGGRLAVRTPERDLLLDGEILHFDATEGVILVDGASWGDSFSPTTIDGNRVSYDPIPYGKALTKAYGTLAAAPGQLGERLDWVLGRAAPTSSRPPGGAASSPTSGSAALQLWAESWGIVWGPPGTGKTECLAEALAQIGARDAGKVLVLAPTHRAVDEIALRVCERMDRSGTLLDAKGRCRVFRGGQGVGDKLRRAFPRAVEAGLSEGDSPAIEDLQRQLNRLIRRKRHSEAATVARELRSKRHGLEDRTAAALESAGPPALIFVTVQKALSLVASQESLPIVSKVLIDEAGMVSRAACLAASALGETVLLAGDPKQIGPICPARLGLLRPERRWLNHSALSHLDTPSALPRNVRFLDRQHRMHPDICRAVSGFAYSGRLKDAAGVAERISRIRLPDGFPAQRAGFVVLDDLPSVGSASAAAHTRAKGRGYERAASARWLADHAIKAAGANLRCLVLSPYRAQVRLIRELVETRYDGDRVTIGTIHRQQGAERDVVLLDLVNAASAWKDEEIEMLLNVALSRARASFILLASRAELRARVVRRFAAQLRQTASSVALMDEAGQQDLSLVPTVDPLKLEPAAPAKLALTLGDEIRELRRRLPLYSQEQLELIERNLGQGHYLVRGVAGSGKTLVLANWALRHLQRRPMDRVLITYFNRGLASMLEAMIEPVRRALGLDRSLIERQLLVECAARADLSEPFDAVFVDEAQDIFPEDLERLYRACRPRPDGKGRDLRSFVLFYDDSQNIYGRKTLEELKSLLPEDFSFSGRSTVLRETFRSTRAVLDTSLNLALDPKKVYGPAKSGLLEFFKVKELADYGLLQRAEEAPDGMYHVRYTDRLGVRPTVVQAGTVDETARQAASLVTGLIRTEGVDPSDILVTSITKPGAFAAALRARGIRAQAFGGRGCTPAAEMPAQGHDFVRCTTVFSCKGHESPIVVFGNVQGVENLSWMGADRQEAPDLERIRRCMLYVAASRAMVKLYFVGVPCKAISAAATYA